MLIFGKKTDARGIAFENLKIGDIFRTPNGGGVYMKIQEINSTDEPDCNVVQLGYIERPCLTGNCYYCLPKSLVIPVECTMFLAGAEV